MVKTVINKETGEVNTYPYLDEKGRLVCDPKPLTVPLKVTKLRAADYQVAHGFYDGDEDDDDFDISDRGDVMPLTEYEINAMQGVDGTLPGTTPPEGGSEPPEGSQTPQGGSEPPAGNSTVQ